MSQQHQHDLGYLDYSSPANRSPSSRQNYAGGAAFASGLSLPRQAQRPFDAPLSSSALYPTERIPAGFNPRALDSMAAAAGMHGGYMLDNGQTWNYSTAGVATVNGAMHGSNRQRSVNRRAALPQNWTDHSALAMPNNLQPFPGSLNGGHMQNGGLRVDQGPSHTSPDLRSTASDGDQLIPTAIVIKNIPFAVRKETLASIMLDMNLPQPYAFNYHFDNGVFRGLAFANFQSAEDTRVVIDAMNGMDVHGRKLRVEYKKMLPEAERERIEREKRERRGQLEEQHRAPMLHQQSSIQSLGGISQTQQRGPTAHLGDVDLNDPQNLEFYTELAMFKRDDTREILVFPPSIAPEHRRSIHILAHNMGLEHQSIGEADSRQLTVLKRQQPSPTANVHNAAVANSLDMHKRGLSRAATFDFAADRESRAASNNYAHLLGRQGPTLELPGSPDGGGIPNNLRAAKSFADLRSFTPSPSQASSSYLVPGAGVSSIGPGSTARFGDYHGHVQPGSSGTPGSKGDNGLVSGLGNLSLSPFDPNTMQTQARNAPGAIGSQRPGASGNSKSVPERQPRGPEWESSAGFGGRVGPNGHVQRGSDSSDSGARVAPNSTGASRYH
ncbi:r3H domain-containing protein [Hirsutella rhossiliensis]|uniref:R3H domain-containing protein n=1 Tax=Hirsutella rhossiliensis TaxID=111463 RepID=A0A9P8N3L2_9HYPO|nr:r3H domain-containing protein [Hirsutella rhossiliensis]KAH0966270.1 r3H domain-containing protein [Hirsutella rhossiliensis]